MINKLFKLVILSTDDATGCDRGNAMKDDSDRPQVICYYVLLVIYTILLVVGVVAFIYAYKAKKLSNKSMITFYYSSLLCNVLRIVLFMDPFANYCLQIYFDLISLPTFLFILTGFSLFLMIMESVLAYHNIEI
jgi:uncharacterized membrane protein